MEIKNGNQLRLAFAHNQATAVPIRIYRVGIPARIQGEIGAARLRFRSKHSAGVRGEVPRPVSSCAYSGSGAMLHFTFIRLRGVRSSQFS